MIESRLRSLELAIAARFGGDDRPPGVPLSWIEIGDDGEMIGPTDTELAAADPRMLRAWQEQLLMLSTIPGPPASE